MRTSHGAWVAVLAAGLCMAAMVPARAQMPMMPSQTGFQPMVKPDPQPGTREPTPTGLPGATPGRGAAAADKSIADMAPNEALFDSINRGDIGQARDAIGRGADLHAQNVLGMTPLELAIDLSRNDITFLLLSFRGAAPSKAVAGTAVPLAIGKTPAKPAAPVKLVAAKEKPPAPIVARDYAGRSDPGTPDPSAGFLGFGRSVQ